MVNEKSVVDGKEHDNPHHPGMTSHLREIQQVNNQLHDLLKSSDEVPENINYTPLVLSMLRNLSDGGV